MKKFTLILSVMLIWGCSQAEDHGDDAVAEVKAHAQEVATDQVEAVKAEAVEKATEKAKEMVADTTATVNKDVKEVVAKAAKFQPGIHYQVINPAWDTESDDVIVYEFFSYMCAHCASFEPYMNKLSNELPGNAKLVRIPVVFYPQWKPAAQAYYTFEAMGLVEKVHSGMFAAIHQHKKQFRNIEEIADWVAQSYGVDKDKFLSTAKSFMIDGQLRKGMQMMQAMGIQSTPTLITNGKYRPNGKALKSRNDVLDITKQLVNQELENMGLDK